MSVLFPPQHVARFVDAAGSFLATYERERAWFIDGTLPVLLAPPLLPAALLAHVRTAARAVHRGLLVVDDALAAGALPPLWEPDVVGRLRAATPGAPARLRSYRLDGIVDVDAGTVSFVEVQAGDPSGPGWVDALQDIATGVVDPAAHGAQAPRLFDALLPLLDDEVRLRGGAAAAHVAFLCPRESLVASDHDAMAAALRRRGRRARRVAMHELCFGSGVGGDDVSGVSVDGVPVDVVWRDTHDDLLPDHIARAAALVRAVPVHNPFADVRFDDKRCFALLRHPSVWQRLSAADRAAIGRSVPLTEAVDDAVARRVRADRAAYVVKPADGYGGIGVRIGGVDADVDVDDALARAGSAPVVVQRRVPNPALPVWTACAGVVREEPRFLTWSFWLVDGDVVGAFVRAGAHAVVNVHQGGGIGPVWIA